MVFSSLLFVFLFLTLNLVSQARLRGVRAKNIAMLAFSLVGFQIVSTNFFQSIGKAGESLLLGLARQVIFLIPLLLWLPSVFHLNGVWMAFPISDALATVVTAALIFWQLRKLTARQSNNL